MNQAFFTKVFVHAGPDGDPKIERVEFTEKFDKLLDPKFRERLGVGGKNPRPLSLVRGLREKEMVGNTGLEPVTSSTSRKRSSQLS